MKRVFTFVLSLSALCLLSSCNPSSVSKEETEELVTFTDAEGEKTVEKNPEKTALLYPSFGDIWLSCGGSVTIGVEDDITRGFASEDITIVGNGTGKDIDLEALVSSEPDFVILSSDFPNHKTLAESLKEYGISYGIFDFSSYEDYLSVLEQFSIINGHPEAYETYGTSQQAKIESIKAECKTKESKKVLLIRSLGSKVSLSALSASNFVGAMINDLNCINIADTDSSLTADLSMEKILKEDPDVILVVVMGDEEKAFSNAKEKFQEDTWSSLSAIKNDRVYYMEKDLFHYKPNTRWGEAYELLEERLFAK